MPFIFFRATIKKISTNKLKRVSQRRLVPKLNPLHVHQRGPSEFSGASLAQKFCQKDWEGKMEQQLIFCTEII
jgi:hypothetical protein